MAVAEFCSRKQCKLELDRAHLPNFRVCCQECGLGGESFQNRNRAIDSWNEGVAQTRVIFTPSGKPAGYIDATGQHMQPLPEGSTLYGDGSGHALPSIEEEKQPRKDSTAPSF